MGLGGLRINGISHPFSEEWSNGALSPERVSDRSRSPSPLPLSSPSSCSSDSKCIEHPVSKMDTLAGIAIKYGVEIADIKRMNGLVADSQMFAHKILQIPLPGRHPPSPFQLNGSAGNREETPIKHRHTDIADSFHSLKLKPPQHKVASPAMRTLQGYYGLTPPKPNPTKYTEMTTYKTNSSNHSEPEPFPKRSPTNGYSLQNGESSSEGEKSKSEKSVRRRQKAEADSIIDSTEPSETGGDLSSKTGKRLFPRPKSGSRIDMDSVPSEDPLIIADTFFSSVRKSSSTSSLAESENGPFMWPTSKWTLNPETIARPFLDGLPKQISVWRNKAALD
uniref:LysM domain-containing protein n=1 Tax=Ananas comosus var. bracteatus TaxID=296719 RepID=A0A6V7PJH8_ANACO|nr:unnamed protein product [Ananas comosus var. bracteatus]